MTGGTLFVNRAVNLLQYYKKRLEEFGFDDVFCTTADKDGLNMVINEMKPKLVMIEAGFYDRATPYMMLELLGVFPELNIAIINMYGFPDENAMWFILYGVKSYVNKFEGIDEYYKGLKCLKDDKLYIAPNIQDLINALDELPAPSGMISIRENEVLQLLCRRYKICEIVNFLRISERTFHKHRENIYRTFNVDNRIELLWSALSAGLINIKDSFYYPRKKTYGGKNVNKSKRKTIR